MPTCHPAMVEYARLGDVTEMAELIGESGMVSTTRRLKSRGLELRVSATCIWPLPGVHRMVGFTNPKRGPEAGCRA